MANVNPTNLSWLAPQENTDGTPIDYDLNYELGEILDSGIEPLFVVVGSLREDNKYYAPLSDLGFTAGEHEVAIRAFAQSEPERKSKWSLPTSFIISDRIPKPPLDLAAS